MRHWTRDPITLGVTALAAYRVTKLAVTDHLPAAETARARVEVWLERHHPEYASLPRCAWCVGWWVSLAAVAAAEACDRRGHRDRYRLVALPWAVSAVVGLLAETERG